MNEATRLACLWATNTPSAWTSYLDMGRRAAILLDENCERAAILVAKEWFDEHFPAGSDARGDLRNGYASRVPAGDPRDRAYGAVRWGELARWAAEDAKEEAA